MSTLSMPDYMKIMNLKCDLIINENKAIHSKETTTTTKQNINEITKIKFEEYNLLVTHTYTNQKIKDLLKSHSLKVSGTKPELTRRLFCFLYLSSNAINIQTCFRKHLVKIYMNCRGPAISNRKMCVNDTDFLTMEPLKEIHHLQFFSFTDKDNFVYGFDIISFYNLVFVNQQMNNPYNRTAFSSRTIRNFRRLLKMSEMLKIPIKTEIVDVNTEISTEKSTELRIFGLFQNINALGNYSEAIWFTSLSKPQLLKFVKELMEIWNYRSQINEETKRTICHPHGNPFRHLNLPQIHNENNVEIIRKEILRVLENMVNRGINNDSKSLGSYYVLGGLTLVNVQAAISIPWLYQSFLYN
jgi:hypothetical protein